MKRKRILKALTILAVAALGLFVSCSGNIMDDFSDTLVYATFDKNSRATSSYTQTVTLKEIKDVYWTYTAAKKDYAGKTGATSTQTAVKSTFGTGLDGAIGPFSQGEWEFTVYGYTSAPTTQPSRTENADWVKVGTNQYYSGLIYQGSGDATLSTGTQNDPDPINVVINLLTAGTGTFKIADSSSFNWQDDSGTGYTGLYLTMVQDNGTEKTGTAYALKYESGKYVFDKNPEDSTLDAGAWNMTFAVVKATVTNSAPTYSGNSWSGIEYTYTTSPELLVKIYTGQTTTLDAKIIEENLAYGEINGTVDGGIQTTVTKTITDNTPTTLSSSITPASASSETVSISDMTTVEIPVGTDGFEAGSTAALTITATPIVTANSLFTISDNTGAVGAIDLKASVTTETNGVSSTEDVDSFTKTQNGTTTPVEVTISTYIAKGMTNVALTYTKDGTTETWNATASSSTDNNIKAPGEGTSGVCYYNAETGQLVYKTTHFSTFLVGADQNVYDADNGIAYVLKDADNDGTYHIYDKNEKIIKESSNDSCETYSSATLGANLVLLDCALSNNVPDAFVSDCTTEDEDKKTWSVIHHNCDGQEGNFWHEKKTSYFPSGYGTKLEPYIIANKTQLQNISKLWYGYAYYKVDKEKFTETDFSDWTSVNYLCGSFDGDGIEIKNLDNILFWHLFNMNSKNASGGYWYAENDLDSVYTIKNIKINANIVYPGWATAIINDINVKNFVMKNVCVHGYIEGSVNTSSYINFGPGQYYRSAGWTYPGNITFENCYSDAMLVSRSETTAGFISHAMMSAEGNINLINSNYTGYMVAVNNFKYVEGNGTGAKINIKTKESESQGDCTYSEERKTTRLEINTIEAKQNFTLGAPVSVETIEGATEALAELQLGPAPGNFVAVYMNELLKPNEGKFITEKIKYFTVKINPEGVEKSGPSNEDFNLVREGCTGLSTDTVIRITQYKGTNEDGYKIPAKITDINFGDKTPSS